MTAKIHRHFVIRSRDVSPLLHAAIVAAGRIEMPNRRQRGLAWFLSRAIVGQQLSTSAARSIWGRIEVLVENGNGSIPEFFTQKNFRALRSCGISNNKVKALIAIREAHESGLLSVRRLRRLPHVERAEVLQEIWGVGQWTADITSIFYFGDHDVWPEGDIAVQKTFQKLCGSRSKTKVLKLANVFAPYRSFLALYMWKVLDAPKTSGGKATTGGKQPV